MTRLYAQNASPKNRQKIRLNNLILLSLKILLFAMTWQAASSNWNTAGPGAAGQFRGENRRLEL